MLNTPDHIVVGAHNSSQQKVIQNNEPALQDPHEHHHDHVRHDADAEKDREDEVVGSYGTTFEGRRTPQHDSQGHDLHRRRHTDMAKELALAVDLEQDAISPNRAEEDPQIHVFPSLYQRYRIFFHLFIWIIFTGWWIAGLLLHGIHDPLSSNTGWLKPFLFWLGITLRMFFFHVSITVVMKPTHWLWEQTAVRIAELLPGRLKIPLAALLTVSVFLIGGFASPESEDNTRDNRAVSLFGLAVFISVLYATSRNRKAVNWHTVIVGMLVCTVWSTFLPLEYRI